MLLQMKSNPYVFGVVPSPIKAGDFVFEKETRPPGAAPLVYKHPAVRKVPVFEQQGSTCVGNSVAAAFMYLQYEERNEVMAFEGEVLNAKVTHKEGEPAWASAVLDAVLLQGAESGTGLYFPKAYAKVDPKDRDAIKVAMSTPGNVVVGAFIFFGGNFPGDPNALGERPKEYYKPVADPSNQGFHEMMLCAYDQQGIQVQNSWDRTWGDGGFALMSWEYVHEHCYELIVITDSADTAGGFVTTYVAPVNVAERAVKHADLPDRRRPAVYCVKGNGRFWIKDIWEAKRMAVDLHKVEILPDTDKVWNLPTIGPDAPPSHR